MLTSQTLTLNSKNTLIKFDERASLILSVYVLAVQLFLSEFWTVFLKQQPNETVSALAHTGSVLVLRDCHCYPGTACSATTGSNQQCPVQFRATVQRGELDPWKRAQLNITPE